MDTDVVPANGPRRLLYARALEAPTDLEKTGDFWRSCLRYLFDPSVFHVLKIEPDVPVDDSPATRASVDMDVLYRNEGMEGSRAWTTIAFFHGVVVNGDGGDGDGNALTLEVETYITNKARHLLDHESIPFVYAIGAIGTTFRAWRIAYCDGKPLPLHSFQGQDCPDSLRSFGSSDQFDSLHRPDSSSSSSSDSARAGYIDADNPQGTLTLVYFYSEIFTFMKTSWPDWTPDMAKSISSKQLLEEKLVLKFFVQEHKYLVFVDLQVRKHKRRPTENIFTNCYGHTIISSKSNWRHKTIDGHDVWVYHKNAYATMTKPE